MKYIEVEPILLKVAGGWINPTAILYAETRGDADEILAVGLVGKDRPIILKGADAKMMMEYLASRTWPKVKEEPQGFIEDTAASPQKVTGG